MKSVPARLHLLIGALWFVLLPASHPLQSAHPPKSRNVVLFVADDMGQDAGCYGNDVVKTPHLDALARSGTLFKDAFCTTASCSPSRAVIMTGLYTHANGQYGLAHGEHNFVTRPEVKSLPILMREAGYRTARFGRTVHVRPVEQYEFEVTVPATGSPYTLEDRLYGRDIVRCADDAGKFIESADSRPFFVMVAACDAHRFGARLEDVPGNPNGFGNNHKYAGVEEVLYKSEEVRVPRHLNDNFATRAELAQYYQSVSRLDQGLGQVVEVLKRTGHWDDTLLIVISDHGAAFPGAKSTVYEPGLRSPCVIRDPAGAKAGVVSDAMISWVDIAPTILDYAGALTKDVKMHGRSILPVLGLEHAPGWGEVYASHIFHEVTMYYPMRVVRDRRYKLISNVAHQLDFPIASDLWNSATWQSLPEGGAGAVLGQRTLKAFLRRPKFELYDLETDPDEVHNLAGNDEHRERLERMVAKLKRFQQKTADPWSIKWKHE